LWQTFKTRSGTAVNINYETIDAGYFSLLKIPLVAGRNFSADFLADSMHSILVNEAFVREAKWTQPVGQLVDFIGTETEAYTVIGVVKDYHFEPLTERIKPQLFTMKPANSFGMAYVRIKSERMASALKTIEGAYRHIFPLGSWNYSFKDVDNRSSYQTESKWRDILLDASVLTIFISCIGLFGLSVLAAERRTKEIGIRKVLGASVSGVVVMLARDFIRLVAIGLLVAMPLAWIAAAHWLENYPYRIALGWTIFGFAGSLVLVIALVTISSQSIRAALGNPVNSLRSE
jgi:putative ABC transport system permease protein